MKKTITATVTATVAVLALGAAIPLAAGAGAGGGHGESHAGHHGGSGMMDRHGGMRGHHGEHHGMHRGEGARAKTRMQEFLDTYDADGDGRVTQDEVDQWRASRLAGFDSDGDGQLSLAEYERLWLDAMRERMVDQFQEHDADGDGQVTADEFGKRTGHMVTMRDRNEDGAISFDDLARHHGRRGGSHVEMRGGEHHRGESDTDAGTSQMVPDAGTTTEQQ